MIRIEEVNKVSKATLDFEKREWEFADLDHFGRKINWEGKKIVLKAIENRKLLGVLELEIKSGVMHIEGLIIKHDKKRHGIGKLLMERAEQIAHENNLHKIFLETGKSWPAAKFYEALGYTVTGKLPNHYEQQDYLEYSKFLK